MAFPYVHDKGTMYKYFLEPQVQSYGHFICTKCIHVAHYTDVYTLYKTGHRSGHVAQKSLKILSMDIGGSQIQKKSFVNTPFQSFVHVDYSVILYVQEVETHFR